MSTRIGSPKTGGRRKGSLDKGERQLVTAEMAGDILAVYRKLGGVKWLLEFAKNNPGEFLRQGLSRLMPAPPKDDESAGNTFNQFNFDPQDSFEAARRIAFVLAKGMNADPSLAPIIDITPETVEPVTPQEMPRWIPPTDVPDMTYELDPERERWASELPLTPEERRDRDLIRETHESIEHYHGSSAEHGRGPIRSPGSVDRDPRAAQRDRMLRRNQLL
jgi:hypothetical protein